MFYLRTGGNGSCKTLFTLFDVRKLQLETGRPVCHNGRFKISAEKEKEFGWKKIEFKDWWEQENGTIFLIDEAYHDLPVRPNGQQPPLHIARLAEHRARGFDFFMLCLHPSQIDSFVRKAIGAPGWHQHLKRVAGASNLTRVLQWDAVHDTPQKDGSGKTAQIATRMQPKEVYAWYDSAFIHTGKVRIPKQVYWLVGGVVAALALGFGAVSALKNNVFKKAPEKLAPGAAPVVPGTSPAGGNRGNEAHVMTAAEYFQGYQARIPGIEHTAPVYDVLTAPKRVPLPAACLESKSMGCKCWTQDATPYPTDLSICRQVVAGGMFLAFAEPAPVAAPAPVRHEGAAPATPAQPVTVAVRSK